jgi:hypothetical protein
MVLVKEASQEELNKVNNKDKKIWSLVKLN